MQGCVGYTPLPLSLARHDIFDFVDSVVDSVDGILQHIHVIRHLIAPVARLNRLRQIVIGVLLVISDGFQLVLDSTKALINLA